MAYPMPSRRRSARSASAWSGPTNDSHDPATWGTSGLINVGLWGAAIIPAYADFVDAMSDKIGHDARMGANFELDGWKCIERWWMA